MSLLADILWASLVLGLPVAGLSWYLVSNLIQSGRLSNAWDPEAIQESVKQAKKDWKEDGKNAGDFIEQRWMKFGGGFYGITALITFVAIELKDMWWLVWNFPGFAVLFENGLISLLVEFFVNQIQNFVAAMIWFTWWPAEDESMFVWGFVAYGAYWVGVYLASKPSAQELWDWFQEVSGLKFD